MLMLTMTNDSDIDSKFRVTIRILFVFGTALVVAHNLAISSVLQIASVIFVLLLCCYCCCCCCWCCRAASDLLMCSRSCQSFPRRGHEVKVVGDISQELTITEW